MKIVSSEYVIEQMQDSIHDLASNTALDQVIEDVTTQIETFCGRKLSIERYDEDVKRHRIDSVDGIYSYLPRYRPVAYAYGDDFSESRIYQDEGAVSYLSGFLYADQTKADIFDRFNLPYDAMLSFPDVPNDVKRVALKLIAYELTSSAQNNFGMNSKTVITGGTTANIERKDPDFVSRELNKLLSYSVVDI